MNKIKKIILAIILLIVYCINLNFNQGINLNFLITNFFISYITLYNCIFSKFNYSLNKIKYLFGFVFLGMAPFIQFQYKSIFWKGTKIDEELYVWINIILIIAICSYWISYNTFLKFPIIKIEKRILKKFKIIKPITSIKILLMLLISFLILIFKINIIGGIKPLFFRGGKILESYTGAQTSQLQNSILNYILYIIPVVFFYYVLYSSNKNKNHYILLGLIAFLINFPLKTIRTIVGILYIPLLLKLKFFSKKNRIIYILFISIFLIFPILDLFRRFNGSIDIKNLKIFDLTLLKSYHFDSYQIFLRAFENNIVTNGKQLLGVILFFIPRKFWPLKPLESGVLISQVAKLNFHMLAINFYGEGFINFGLVGVVIFAIIKGLINARLDRIYWKYVTKNKKIILFKIMYLFFLGLEFIIHRGPLMSVYSITIGLIVSVFLAKIVLK